MNRSGGRSGGVGVGFVLAGGRLSAFRVRASGVEK